MLRPIDSGVEFPQRERVPIQLEQARRSVALLANWRSSPQVQPKFVLNPSDNQITQQVEAATSLNLGPIISDKIPTEDEDWNSTDGENGELVSKLQNELPIERRNLNLIRLLESFQGTVDDRLLSSVKAELGRMQMLSKSHMDYISYVADLMNHWTPEFDLMLSYRPQFIQSGSTIFGIGQNDDGQVGIPNDEHDGGYPCTSKFRRIEVPNGIEVLKFCCGAMHTLAITNEGQLLSWGFSECLGRSGKEEIPAYVAFPDGIAIRDIACSEYASACLDINGSVWIWGAFRVMIAHKDELGTRRISQTDQRFDLPVKIEIEARFCKITAGESHFAALCTKGTVFTWGIAEYGQLGRPFSEPRIYSSGSDFIPAQLYLPEPVLDVFSCGFCTFIKTESGLFGCGKNSFGELGLGDTEPKVYFHRLNYFDGHKVINIAGGLHHCLVLTDKGLFGMGKNVDGQLGLGPDIDYVTVPTKIDVENVVFVAAGQSSHHSYVINAKEELLVAGQNQYEHLGHQESLIFNFKKVNLKGRRCWSVGGGCQFTLCSLSTGPTQFGQ